jgi:hypothetical protein
VYDDTVMLIFLSGLIELTQLIIYSWVALCPPSMMSFVDCIRLHVHFSNWFKVLQERTFMCIVNKSFVDDPGIPADYSFTVWREMEMC